jgi:hypothetical protein
MRITWLRGDPDGALALAKDCAADVLSLDHDLSICYGLAIGCIPVAFWCGDLTAAKEWNRYLMSRTTKRGLRHWQVWADGFAAILDGRNVFPDDASAMQAEVFAAISADAYSEDLQVRHDVEGSLWCGPEILRVSAMRAGEQSAKTALDAALVIAERQGAAAWMKRIALSQRQSGVR